MYPASVRLGKRLEIALRLSHWKDISEAQGVEDGRVRHTLTSLAVNYYFDRALHWGLSLEHVDGENPTEDLADQRYTQLGLAIKY